MKELELVEAVRSKDSDPEALTLFDAMVSGKLTFSQAYSRSVPKLPDELSHPCTAAPWLPKCFRLEFSRVGPPALSVSGCCCFWF